MMRFLKQYVGHEEATEVAYEDALRSLLTTYKDNEITRDMLAVPGEIPYKFGTIFVKEEVEP